MAWLSVSESGPDLDALASRARAGDRDAFAALYRGLYPVVARYVARRVRVAADAEDLVSKTFERMVAKLQSFDPARGCIEAWVVRIARNAIIDAVRASRPELDIDQLAELPTERRNPAEQLMASEELAALAARLEACDADFRRLLGLRFGDGLRHRAIAELLGVSEATVRKRLSRGLQRLRAAPDASTPDDTVEPATKEVEYVC